MSQFFSAKLPEHWVKVNLGDLARIEYGKALHTEVRAGSGGVLVYGSSGIVGEHNISLHSGPSIIIGRKGNVGSVYYESGPFWCIDTAFFLSNINSHVDLEYLSFFIQTRNLSNLSLVVGVPGISRKDLEEVQILLPPLPEQQRIADILRRVDELRHLRSEANRKAEKLLPALFHEMFGDPVRNERGWKERRLEELVDVESSLVDPKKEQYAALIHVGSDNIEAETGRLIDLRPVGEVKAISGKFLFTEDDILYSKIRPALKKVATPDFVGLCSADIYPLTIKGLVTKHFVAQLLRTNHFTQYTARVSGRAQIPKINREDLLEYKTFVPDLEKQVEFEEKAYQLLTVQATKDKVTDDLETLFNSLLAQAFSGELTAQWRAERREELAEAARQRDDALARRQAAPRELVLGLVDVAALEEEQAAQRERPARQKLDPASLKLLQELEEQAAYFRPADLAGNGLTQVEIEERLRLLAALGFILPVVVQGQVAYRLTGPDDRASAADWELQPA
ncbi:MAG TPA: restriction endonuclease subunit S [Chloroflexia bacterium]|nr:restriction endonuclease subunit S [Chloroflexia bacterium]